MVQNKSLQIKNNLKVKNKKIKHLLIASLLFLFWVTLSLWNLNKNLGITVLTVDHEEKDVMTKDHSELLSGEKIKGEFIAKYNNLGIVAVRFNTYSRINDDVVTFRVKQKGSAQWFYEYQYTTPQFQPNQYFTFGFPIIADSLGKKYVFEIESTKGEHDNAVALSTIEPVFESKYQYSKDLILKDFKKIIGYIPEKINNPSKENYAVNFLVNKSINSFTNADYLISVIAYSLPLVLYLVWLFFFDKFLKKKYYLLLIPILLMIIISLANMTRVDTAVMGITLLWFFTSFAYRLKSTFSFFFSLLFLLISIVFLYASFSIYSTNFSAWGLLLLFVGVVQQIIELKWPNIKLLGIHEIRKIYFK